MGKVGAEVLTAQQEKSTLFPCKEWFPVTSWLDPLRNQIGYSLGAMGNGVQLSNKADKLNGEPKSTGVSFQMTFLHVPGVLSCLTHISLLYYFQK